jgi:hypothetical protein
MNIELLKKCLDIIRWECPEFKILIKELEEELAKLEKKPLTDDDIRRSNKSIMAEEDICNYSFTLGFRAAEKHHGITK